MIIITYGQIILFGVLVIIGVSVGNFVKYWLEIRRLNDIDEQPRNEVKERFWILNKIYKNLLPADRRQIDFMFDVIRREMDFMLGKSAEKRKGSKTKKALKFHQSLFCFDANLILPVPS